MLARRAPYAYVDGWPINIANPTQAVAEICRAAEQSQCFSVLTLNLDHLVKLRSDAAFRKAFDLMHFVTADGTPVAYMAGRAGTGVVKTTGSDLVVPLARAASDRNLPIYLFGTSPKVLEKAERHLQSAAGHKLQIAGATSPPLGFDPASSIADAALDTIAASGAKLCLVALSSPKGEMLAARAVERGIPIGFVCIGAALDFIAGHQRRAPKVFQNTGLEWLWRLGSNPKRFTVRYAKCALVLADIARRSLIHRQPSARSS